MINPNWLPIVEVIANISEQPYACPVNKTILQKIPYILTEQGIETGFTFTQVDYGLASMGMTHALSALTQMELIREYLVGRTTIIQVDGSYRDYRNKHQTVLDKYSKKIDRTVDLFSRLKNSEQAQEVIAVLFSAKTLKKKKGSPEVSEKEVMNAIISWKRSWSLAAKYNAVMNTMRQLQQLGWVRLQQSDINVI
jgi:hypothetical protein